MCDVGGVRLHLVDWGGNGPPLVLLAGLNNSARIFDRLAPLLARKRHVFAFTRRGFGKSDQVGPYDQATLVGDIAALLDRLAIARADFVGHSIAGGELTAFAVAHPNRVRRLVYLDAAYNRAALSRFPADPIGSRAPPTRARRDFAALARWRAFQLHVSASAVAPDLAQTYKKGPDGLLEPVTDTSIAKAVSAGDRAVNPDYSHLFASALALYAPKLRAEQVPLGTSQAQRRASDLYARSYGHPWMVREKARFLSEARCGSTEIVTNGGHYFFLARSRYTAQRMLRFLDQSRDGCKVASAGAE